MNESKPFTSIKSFAAVSGLSIYFVRQLIQADKIPFIRSGTKYYIDTEKGPVYSARRWGQLTVNEFLSRLDGRERRSRPVDSKVSRTR